MGMADDSPACISWGQVSVSNSKNDEGINLNQGPQSAAGYRPQLFTYGASHACLQEHTSEGREEVNLTSLSVDGDWALTWAVSPKSHQESEGGGRDPGGRGGLWRVTCNRYSIPAAHNMQLFSECRRD